MFILFELNISINIYNMSQVCNTCQVNKDFSQYYKSKTYYFKKCRECTAFANKKPKKATGFAALDPAIQGSVILQLQNRRLKMKAIAANHNIAYANLCYWVSKGQVV